MSRVLDMIWADIVTTWASITDWLNGLAGAPGAWVIPAVLLLVVVLIVLLLALLPGGRRRERRAESRPELLVSRGEVRSVEESSVTELKMHVSNLGDSVAQLLEVALSSDLMPTPETAELSAIVPRNSSVDVNLPVEELHGDTGYLDLYFYTPQTRRRAYRLRANLTWEPWNGRFKVDPLGQRIDPARRLASSRLQRRQRDEWRRRRRELLEIETEPPPQPSEPQPERREEDEEPVARRERLEFPSDF
ncbi:MAG TPA: hypothetical protein VF168_02765 [Trueperaceae bacterium]